MKCSKCGRENPEEAAFCAFCSAALSGEESIGAETPYGSPQTSGLAKASLVLGLLGLLTAGLTAILGLILGIVALRQIRQSEGRLAGDRLAKSGIAASAVIAVIVTLVLVPVFGRAREKAQQSKCMVNIHQVCMAIGMYCEKWDTGGEHPSWPLAENWCDALLPYLTSGEALEWGLKQEGAGSVDIRPDVGRKELFKCPSIPEADCGYRYNGLLHLDIVLPRDPASIITPPEDLAIIFDGIFDGATGWNVAGGPASLELRHFGSACVGYADGHAGRVTSAQELELLPFVSGGQSGDL